MSGVSPAELAEHAFARGLPAGSLDRLASLAANVEMPAGQRIFEEGEHASRLWLIRTGRVVLDLRVPGRARLIVETLGPGDELGLSWLITSAAVAVRRLRAATGVGIRAAERGTCRALRGRQ